MKSLDILKKCVLVRDIVGILKQLLYKYKKYDNNGDIIEQRKQMKESKDYSSADRIREMLTSHGILIKDTREGTEWNIEISPRKIYKVN